jgi:hypothetical protein
MKHLILISMILLTGCTTVPVKRTFPEAPQNLLEKCSNLQQIPNKAKLSEVAKVVSNNYTLYHECALKQETFIEWYKNQKKIFESVD